MSMKGQVQSLFVGYQSLEEWRTAVDVVLPVFGALTQEVGKVDRFGMHTNRLVIMVAQPEEDLVHYCRLVVGVVQYMTGQPFYADHQKRLALAEQAWKIVEDWLIEQGLTVRNGVIAVPQNLALMDGDAHFLVFDNERQVFRLRDK